MSEQPVAFVTGGTKGIGASTVLALLAEGYKVAFTARTESDVRDLEREWQETHPGSVEGLQCDVRNREACDRAIQDTVDRFGRLDVVVNNAGVGVFESVATMTDEEWSVQIDTNLSGVFYCSRAAIPHLKEAGGGWIFNVGSLAGRNSFAGGAAYNATKFGLLGMSEAMMLDLRYDGIRVTCVMPGSVNTYFGGGAPEEESWKLAPEDVARAITDLLRYPGRAHPSRIELRPSMPSRS